MKERERDGGKRGRMICRRRKEDGREKGEIPQMHEELSYKLCRRVSLSPLRKRGISMFIKQEIYLI